MQVQNDGSKIAAGTTDLTGAQSNGTGRGAASANVSLHPQVNAGTVASILKGASSGSEIKGDSQEDKHKDWSVSVPKPLYRVGGGSKVKYLS